MKICTKCGDTKPFGEFHKHKASKDGLKSRCKECNTRDAVEYAQRNKDKVAERVAKWQKENRDKCNANQRRWVERNPEEHRRQRKEIDARRIPKAKAWIEANRLRVRAIKAAWKRRNLAFVASDASRRRAIQLRAVPGWADQRAIDQYYLIASYLSAELGIEFQVDHIVPLRSEIVQGFHSQHNLNVSLGAWNLAKSNRWWPHMP